MGTAILRPKDCLRDLFGRENEIEIRTSSHCRNPNGGSRSRRRMRSSLAFCSNQDLLVDRSQSRSMVVKFPVKNIVMGEVKILKRGEALGMNTPVKNGGGCENRKARAKSEDLDLVLGSTDRLGPDPEIVQKHVRVSDRIYAGSGFFTSPPPSSVPLPGFLRKNGEATSDLRRLLRLDLV